MKQYILSVSLLMVGALGCISAAMAQSEFYAVDQPGRLGRVDFTTGNYTLIGNMGTVMTDIAFALDGTLYGISTTQLYTINTTTAAPALIGSFGIADQLNSLVFKSNILYAVSTTGNLVSIATASGAATVIGNTGHMSSGDLAVGSNGMLYLTDSANNLVQIDPLTATATAIGATGTSSNYGLGFRSSNSTMYGYSYTTNQFYTANLTTGQFQSGTPVSGVSNIYGMAVLNEAAAAMPEPGTLILVELGIAGLALRRRSRP